MAFSKNIRNTSQSTIKSGGKHKQKRKQSRTHMLLYYLMHSRQHRSLLPALPTSLALWSPRKEKNTMGVRMTTVLIFVVFWMIVLPRRRCRDALLQDHMTRRQGRNSKGASKLLVVDHHRPAKGAENVCCAQLIVKGWMVKRIITLNLHQATGAIVMRLVTLNFHQPMSLHALYWVGN
jgi:hypothetical protein